MMMRIRSSPGSFFNFKRYLSSSNIIGRTDSLSSRTDSSKDKIDHDDSYVLMSTYAYVDLSKAKENRWRHVFRSLDRFCVKGRIYVSQQGANAQVAVPKSRVEDFRETLRELHEPLERRLVKDVELTEKEFREYPPFKNKLQVKSRELVSLGNSKDLSSLNFEDCGNEISPREWDRDLSSSNSVVVLDVRNKYESEVGQFENAVPLNTTQFKETWDRLREILKDKSKDEPVYMYCTGGIRCVAAGSFVKQELGFQNIKRLEGGIVGYLQYRKKEDVDHDENRASKFRGINYVFNGRHGECYEDLSELPESTLLTDERRGVEALQVLDERSQRREPKSPSDCDVVTSRRRNVVNARETYAERHTTAEHDELRKVREMTHKAFPRVSHMVSGPLQGQFLNMLSSFVQANRVLELGTFTAYGTLCFALSESVKEIITCDSDCNAVNVAQSVISKSEWKDKIRLIHANASDTLKRLSEEEKKPFDLIYLDCDKRKYLEYYETIMSSPLIREGTVIVADNVLWKDIAALGHDNDDDDDERSVISRRYRLISRAMDDFNVHVNDDSRTEQVVLPIQDGLSLIRVTSL